MSRGKLTKRISKEEFSFETRSVVLNYFSLLPPADLSASKTSGSSSSDPLSASGRVSAQASTPGESRPDSGGIQGEETCSVVPLAYMKKPSFDQLPIDKDAQSQFQSGDLPLIPLRTQRSRTKSPQRPLTLDLGETAQQQSGSSNIPFASYPGDEDDRDQPDAEPELIAPRLVGLQPGRESPAPDDFSIRSTRGSFTGSELLTESYVDQVSITDEDQLEEGDRDQTADLTPESSDDHVTTLAHIAGSSVVPVDKDSCEAESDRALAPPTDYVPPLSAGFLPCTHQVDEEFDTLDTGDPVMPKSETSEGAEAASNTSTATTVSVSELDLPTELKGVPFGTSSGSAARQKKRPGRLDSSHSGTESSDLPTPSDASSGLRWSLRSSTGSSGRLSVMAMSNEELASLVRSLSLPPQVLTLREELLNSQAEIEREHHLICQGEGDQARCPPRRSVAAAAPSPAGRPAAASAPAAGQAPTLVSPNLRLLTPESEVARQLCILGDHIEAEYGEIFQQALDEVVSQGMEFTTDHLLDVARREHILPDATTPSWKSIAMWLQFTSHVAHGILHHGGHRIRSLIDSTAQVLEDRMAGFVISQGGWAAIQDLEIETPDSPSVLTPHFPISPSSGNPLDAVLNPISETQEGSRCESAASSTQDSLTIGEENNNTNSLTDVATPGSVPGSTASTEMWQSTDTVKEVPTDVNSNVNGREETVSVTLDVANNLNAGNMSEEDGACINGCDHDAQDQIDVEKVRKEIHMMRQISEQLTGEGGPQPDSLWKKAVFVGSIVLLGGIVIYMIKRQPPES